MKAEKYTCFTIDNILSANDNKAFALGDKHYENYNTEEKEEEGGRNNEKSYKSQLTNQNYRDYRCSWTDYRKKETYEGSRDEFFSSLSKYKQTYHLVHDHGYTCSENNKLLSDEFYRNKFSYTPFEDFSFLRTNTSIEQASYKERFYEDKRKASYKERLYEDKGKDSK